MKLINPVFWPGLLLVVLDLTACAAEPPPATTPAPAVTNTAAAQVRQSPTPTPQPTAASAPAPVSSATPTPRPSPLPVPTSTPEPEPVVRVDESLTGRVNVRTGPGVAYPVIEQFEPGQEAVVTGQNEARDWWQIELEAGDDASTGWIFGELVSLTGDEAAIPVVGAPPLPPTATPPPSAPDGSDEDNRPQSARELADTLRCGKDFCVTYQAMVPIWENGGCIGNHSIYITVLEGLPPGKPMDGVVIGDTFGNVEVASGSKGPGAAEITLWMNSMTLIVKRHIDGTPYTSEESFNFTAHDELIPAEVLAANGYCEGSVEKCRWAQQNNQICRGHYSWRVTFHKFD